MKKQMMRVAIIILVLSISSLVFVISCGEFSLYEWSGVPLPGQSKYLTKPYVFFVVGEQLKVAPLPSPEMDGFENIETLCTLPDLMDGKNLVINRASESVYWAKNNFIYRVKIDEWDNVEVIVNYTDGFNPFPVTHFDINEFDHTLYFTTGESNWIKKVNAEPGSPFSDKFTDPTNYSQPYFDLVIDSNDGTGGSLFYSNNDSSGTNPNVKRYWFQNNSVSPLWPVGTNVAFLGLDPDRKLIYYMRIDMQIFSTDYTGGQYNGPFGFSPVPTILRDMAIDFVNGFVYFAEDTTPTTGRILRASDNGGTTVAIHNEPNDRITALSIFIP